MLIIGQPVRPGREDDYLAWEKKILAAAARYPGYRGSEVKAPNDIQPDWVIVYKFDSVGNVQNWLNSSTRQRLINEAAHLFDGPGTHAGLWGPRGGGDAGGGQAGRRRPGGGVSGLAEEDGRGGGPLPGISRLGGVPAHQRCSGRVDHHLPVRYRRTS